MLDQKPFKEHYLVQEKSSAFMLSRLYIVVNSKMHLRDLCLVEIIWINYHVLVYEETLNWFILIIKYSVNEFIAVCKLQISDYIKFWASLCYRWYLLV